MVKNSWTKWMKKKKKKMIIITIITGLEQRDCKRYFKKSFIIFTDLCFLCVERIDEEGESKELHVKCVEFSFFQKRKKNEKISFYFCFSINSASFARWSVIGDQALAKTCALDLIACSIMLLQYIVQCCWLGNMKHRKRYFFVSPSYYTVHTAQCANIHIIIIIIIVEQRNHIEIIHILTIDEDPRSCTMYN